MNEVWLLFIKPFFCLSFQLLSCTEEVNKEINNGATVVELRRGDAIMNKKKESKENVRLSLSEFTIIVVVSEKND
jgi:hypothetical protein